MSLDIEILHILNIETMIWSRIFQGFSISHNTEFTEGLSFIY